MMPDEKACICNTTSGHYPSCPLASPVTGVAEAAFPNVDRALQREREDAARERTREIVEKIRLHAEDFTGETKDELLAEANWIEREFLKGEKEENDG